MGPSFGDNYGPISSGLSKASRKRDFESIVALLEYEAKVRFLACGQKE